MRQTSRGAVVAALMLVAAGAAFAQNPPPPPPRQPGGPPQDTSQGPMMQPGMMRPGMMQPGMMDQERAQQLRAQIEERFGQRVKMELSLTDQQMERLRAAMRANQDRHRDLDRREEDLGRGVMEQLRPGVAANQDSLGRLLDAIAANRVARAQSEQQELRELAGFLNSVQRARLLLMRRQLMDRMEAIREGRLRPGMGPGPMRPGPGPMQPAPGPRRPRPNPPGPGSEPIF